MTKEKEIALNEALRLLDKGITLREGGKHNGKKVFQSGDSYCIQQPNGYVFSIPDINKFDFYNYKPSGIQ